MRRARRATRSDGPRYTHRVSRSVRGTACTLVAALAACDGPAGGGRECTDHTWTQTAPDRFRGSLGGGRRAPRLAYAPDGLHVLLVHEHGGPNDPVTIDTSSWTGAAWSPPQTLSVGDNARQPDLEQDGETLRAVWSDSEQMDGAASGVFYATYLDGLWSSPVNLTAAIETPSGRFGWGGDLAVGPAGQQAIAYVSTGSGADSIKVASIEEHEIVGEPVEIATGCEESGEVHGASFDGSSVLHVWMDCEGGALGEVDGSWTAEDLAPDTFLLSVKSAPDGVLHRLTRFVGGGPVLYSRRSGATWGTDVEIPDATDAALAVGADGRVVLAYTDRDEHLFMLAVDEAGTPGAPCEVPYEPDPFAARYTVASVALAPDRGGLVISYEIGSEEPSFAVLVPE